MPNKKVKKYQSIVVIGRKGSGKTYYISKKLLPELDVKKSRRFLISPTAENDDTLSKKFNKENVFLQFKDDILDHIKSVIEEETKELTFKFHHRWDKEKEEYVVIKSRIKKKPQLPAYLLIADDCAGSKAFKQNGALSCFYTRHRHLRTHVITVSHAYRQTPVLMRVNSNRLIIFNQNNSEMSKIEQEHSKEPKSKDFFDIFRQATDPEYGTFIIDYYSKPIYKNK